MVFRVLCRELLHVSERLVVLVLATQKALVFESQPLGWQIATAVVAIGVGGMLAVWAFERQEL